MAHARFVVPSKKAAATEIPDTQAEVDDGSSESNEDSQGEDFEVTSKKPPAAPKPKSSSSQSVKLPDAKPHKKATTTGGKQRLNKNAAASDGDEGDLDEDDVSTRSSTSKDSTTTTTKVDKGKYAGGGKSKNPSKKPTSVPQPQVAAKPVARAHIPVGNAAAEGAPDDLVADDLQPSEVLLYMSCLLLSCGDRV